MFSKYNASQFGLIDRPTVFSIFLYGNDISQFESNRSQGVLSGAGLQCGILLSI